MDGERANSLLKQGIDFHVSFAIVLCAFKKVKW